MGFPTDPKAIEKKKNKLNKEKMKALGIGRRHTLNVLIKEKKAIQVTPVSTVPLSSVQTLSRVPGSSHVPGFRANLGLAEPYHIFIGVCRCLGVLPSQPQWAVSY